MLSAKLFSCCNLLFLYILGELVLSEEYERSLLERDRDGMLASVDSDLMDHVSGLCAPYRGYLQFRCHQFWVFSTNI